MTYGALLRCYLLAGLVAGVLGALYLWILGEPVIRAGLRFEDAYDAAHASAIGPQGPELFTRSQQVVGGMVALVFVGLILAFLFATLYAFLRHRIVGDLGDVKASAGLALVTFGLTVVVPWIRYPFLPPGMGNGATVLKRAFWELFLIVACIAAFVVVEVLVARLKGRISDDARWILAIVAPIVVIGAIMYVFPSVGDPYPQGISAPMIWSFRIRSLGNYALYWAIVGIFGGWLVSRVAAAAAAGRQRSAPDRGAAVSPTAS